ncbi:hypothetical protein L207DRAFT_415975, partial [Hyaloscypha variabilis F]
SLSSQLYEKSTHFLLELIQNADDNTYTCANPTLSFSYRPGSLRIDYNEVGFTAENVEAICAISRSTKSGKTSYGEYIGEKGIGFKSVFKAADVVWISSREFTFKFDKTKFLGIVTPVWADFPEPTQPGWTSIFLQLSDDYEEDTLMQELLTFDNNLLIFLRRIEVINIRVSCQNEQVWEKTVRKTESSKDDDRIIVLQIGETTFQYLIRTHIIRDLPKEHKRPNWPQTKLLLAFPISDFLEQPQIFPQNVYAFLPIRNYGLKFLLQGDFLLTASREDIESTLPWNRALRDAVAEAFLQSIHHFNKGKLKYIWPYYLPSTSTGSSSFFEPVVASILSELRESFVFESCAGIMVKPSSLKHVPLNPFADGEGKPFTLGPQTEASYLSLKYPAWVVEAIGAIGVSQLSPQEFLQDLSSAVKQDPTTFHTRSATWHSQLSETLVKLGTDAELLTIIQDISLIPLNDGTWTCAKGHAIFLSKSETSLEIPGGIEVFVLDSTAEADPNRRKLFTSLGVKSWEAPEICRLILQVHASPDFDPKSLTRNQLISHAMFLYKASWQPPKTSDLWFATMQGECCLGRKLYIPGSIAADSPAGRIFAQLQKKFSVIHKDYLEASTLDADWPLWLVSNLDHIGPPVEDTQSEEVKNDEKLFTLSEEFEFMFSECRTSDVLQLFRDNWHYYSKWIEGAHMKWQHGAFLAARSHLKSTLGVSRVQSAAGPLPLQETVLPKIDIELDEEALIPALDINNAQHPEWALLSNFGVLMKGDINYYLRCLIAISDGPSPNVDKVAYIYEQIQTRYRENEDIIRAAFYQRDIVFVHPKTSQTSKPLGWINMDECISNEVSIESDYPTSSYLFRCLLSPSGDPIAPLVAAATLVTSSSRLEDISRHFRNISKALKDVNASKAAQLLRPLQHRSIFPIINYGGKRSYDDLTGLHDTSWFIADRPSIRESLRGKIPLLALPIEDLPALEDLFHVLRLKNRLLSKITTIRTNPKGRVTTHWSYTASLRAKAPFIKALIPHSCHDRTTVARQVDEVRVSVATQISQTFLLKLTSTNICGSPVRGQVSLSSSGGYLNLFMTEECANAECPPHELVRLVAEACNITDPNHFSLLYTALSNSRLESISAAFTQQGINVKGLKSRRYLGQRRNLFHIPSPFWGDLNRMKASIYGQIEATRFDRFGRMRGIYSTGRDRRLPIIRVVGESWLIDQGDQDGNGNLVYQPDSIVGWEHVQYLGEHIVRSNQADEPQISKLLQKYLGDVYDPERDWTSVFRSRSGYKLFESSTAAASFILKDTNVRNAMTAFIMEYGQSYTPGWKESLQASPPIYHLDVAVSTGSKTSSFVIESSQIKRMQNFRVHGTTNQPARDIAILFRVSDIHSDNLSSVSLFVDPWVLFDSNDITVEENWLFKGTLQERRSESTSKRRKLHTPSVSWDSLSNVGRQTRSVATRDGHQARRPYTYKSLESGYIRLLYLFPGEQGGELQGIIFHIPHESSGLYRALSYVWGTNQLTHELATPDGNLPITSSLHKALSSLRDESKAVLLWVDAICINQESNAEKSQQIRLLPVIFQRASSTCAFLEGGEGSDAAIEMLMQVRYKDSHAEWTRFDLEEWPKYLPKIPASWHGRSIPPLDDDIWTSVRALFDLSWFRRVWIIQEVVAAPVVKIVCGKWIIDWEDLHLATEIIDREVQLSDDNFLLLKKSWEPFLSLAAQREWEAREYRWTLIMLLENFRYAESTLSRDHFFALLGLASDGNEAAFEPDYESPLEVIVLRFARIFVHQGRGMQLLYRAGLTQQSSRFPSWIPNWTTKIPSGLHDSSECGVSYSASGSHRININCIPDSDELAVQGFAVDVIQLISKSSNIEQEWEQYFNEIDYMVNSLNSTPLRDFREDLKWKVPIADILYPKVAASAGLDLRSSYKEFRQFISKGKYKGKAMDANAQPGSLQNESMGYIAALQDTLHGWRFVITKKGYVGVVPNMAQRGDTIAIFKGGMVPFILQRSTQRLQTSRLIGECYVHGIMNGEGLSLQDVVESEFRLH